MDKKYKNNFNIHNEDFWGVVSDICYNYLKIEYTYPFDRIEFMAENAEIFTSMMHLCAKIQINQKCGRSLNEAQFKYIYAPLLSFINPTQEGQNLDTSLTLDKDNIDLANDKVII